MQGTYCKGHNDIWALRINVWKGYGNELLNSAEGQGTN